MTIRAILTVAAVSLAMTATGYAEPAKVKRKTKPAVHSGLMNWPGANSMAPARMIEIRPGIWVSSYGCVFEDSQGRILDCQTSSTSP